MKPFVRALLLWSLLVTTAVASDKSPIEQMLALANQGNVEAQYHAGMMYNNGSAGAPKDTQKAFSWFQKSAQGNHPLGSFKLGCYFAGQCGQVPVDHEKALKYKLIAARAGYSLAQGDVGNKYGEQGNFTEASKWWSLASDQGHEQSTMNLAVSYLQGNGVQESKKTAYVYLQRISPTGELGRKKGFQEKVVAIKKGLTAEELSGAEQEFKT